MGTQGKAGNQSQDIRGILGIDQSASLTSWRKWRWQLVTVVIVFAGALFYGVLGTNGANDRTSYLYEPVETDDLTVIVTATGTVEPTNQVDISSELSGTIRKVLVDYNSSVTQGQELAELDTDKLEASVESSKAKLAAAKAQVKNAEATRNEMKVEYDRKRELVSRQVSSEHDLDAAKAAFERSVAAVESAKADVAAATADLKLNETNLAKSCICSPISGVVLKRDVDPGQTVASSLQAPVLFTIAEDLTKMEVQVDVDEADVGKVREGQKASFTVDAYVERTFIAEIKELRYGSEIVQGVVTYKAVLSTDNSELLLRPGMTATAEITVEEIKQAVTVPNAALRFSPPANKADDSSFLKKLLQSGPRVQQVSRNVEQNGSERAVYTLVDGAPKRMPVSVGSTDGQRTQIVKGGLEPGQMVIVDTAPAR